MTMRVGVIVGMGLVLVGGSAAAQTSPPGRPGVQASIYIDPSGGLTLADAIARALEREPALRAARSEVDVARGLRSQADLRPNPTVSFAQQEEPAGSDRETRIEIQWPLDLYRKTGRVGVAEREIDVARSAAADQERALATAVRMAYGEAASAIRTLGVTDDLLAATTRMRDLVGARVDQGAAPPLDRDMLRVEVVRLESDRLLRTGEVERRLLALKRLVGTPADAPLRLGESLDDLLRREAPAGLPPGDEQAAAVRPDVREAEARIGAADAAIERASREGQIDVTIVGGYTRTDAGFPQLAFSSPGTLAPIRNVFHYVSIGAMVTLPLQNRGQGAVAAARAEREAAAARLDAARLTAQSDIASARVRDAHASRALEAYSADALALAQRNLETVQRTYDLGRSTLMDVLGEQRRYLELQRAYTEVLREAYDARQTLKSALGETR